MIIGFYKINTPFIIDSHYEIFKEIKKNKICDKLVVFLSKNNELYCKQMLNNIIYVDLVTSDISYNEYDVLITDNKIHNKINKKVYIHKVPIKYNLDNICNNVYSNIQTNARDKSRLYW